MNGSNDVNNKHDVVAGVDVANKNVIFFVTHFNVFLYATCFFIQVGTMPVMIFFYILFKKLKQYQNIENVENVLHF